MSTIVVSDTGPLIALGKLQKLDLLKRLYDRAVAPKAVIEECLIDPKLGGAASIQDAANRGLIEQVDDPKNLEQTEMGLDRGETAALLVAQDLHASVLIDETRGRTVAKKLGIPLIGTIGIIVGSKQKGLITAAKPLLLAMRTHGYFMSDELLRTALERCGEAE